MAQTRIKISEIHEGMCYTAPVFFDDGKNMFLAEGKPVRPFHLKALERWSIPFLLTYGEPIIDNKVDEKKPKPLELSTIFNNSADDDDLEKMEDLELLEEADDVEPVD